VADRTLEGRTALVTGAGRGIGRAIAEALAEAGATVVAMSRTEEQLAEVVAAITAAGGRAIAAPADLQDAAGLVRAYEEAVAQVGGIDILVNDAGNNFKRPTVPLPVPEGTAVGQPGSDPADMVMTDENWDAVLDTHVRGAVALARLAVPGMLERRWGRIINIGSTSVARSSNLTAPYQVAKATMTALTMSWAKEWAEYGITVNAIGPGHFRTELTKRLHDSEEGQAWLRERIPMRHTGDPREIGALAVYMAGPLSSYMTGQVVYVDGGETL
jgi:NAD(P)-dependent dehydrogenase (short-subunit alcohol dehydrogenase family)